VAAWLNPHHPSSSFVHLHTFSHTYTASPFTQLPLTAHQRTFNACKQPVEKRTDITDSQAPLTWRVPEQRGHAGELRPFSRV